MVAFPTPARAATRSMHSPSGPDSANRLRAASMMAWSARSLRGRPGRRVATASALPALTGPALALTGQPSARTGAATYDPAEPGSPTYGPVAPASPADATTSADVTGLSGSAAATWAGAIAGTGSAL